MVSNISTTANGSAHTNGTHSSLPSSKSPALELVHPTKEELLSIWGQNGAEWRGALSMSAYLRRELHLSSQDQTKDGGITYWILIDTSANDRTILSACESYRKKAIVVRDGKTKDVVSHGIGSVFCPPECRRRGYAARMMKELGEKLKTWQVGEKKECMFSILYSDIGKEFYAQHGWEPFNSAHISIRTLPAQLNANGIPAARPLYDSDLAELCRIDEQLIRKTAQDVSAEQIFVALLPDISTIRWHHAREEFVANELLGRIPRVKGAIVGTEPGKRVWCYWTRMFYSSDPTCSEGNTLHILRLVVEERGLFTWERASADEDMSEYIPAISALFRLAHQDAAQWMCEEVQVWNPTETTVKAAQAICYPELKVVHRDSDSIASLMWYGDKPKDGPVADYVDWLGNEKYGWC